MTVGRPTLVPSTVLSLSSLLTLLASPASPADGVQFVDVTRKTGIDFVEECGSREKDWIIEVNGSGVALFDYDNDGDLDIYFVNCGHLDKKKAPPPSNRLYRNGGGWKFDDVTEAAGVGDDGWGSGVAVADIDNDGHLDLYVTNWGPNVLYRNRGDGTFARLSDSGAEDSRWGASASFADFNRDGRVDLYVTNYLEFEAKPEKRRGTPSCTYKGIPIFCGPGGFEGAPDSLFLNTGDGKFRDVSEAWGVRRVPPSYGLGTLVVDVERNGWPDVVVSNDTHRNFCFLNNGGHSFTEAGLFLGLAYNDYGVEQAGMGLASGDTRGTGAEDIFVANYEDDTNTLYLSEGEGRYVEGTFPAGLGSASYRYLSWGAFFFDAEGDGDLDLFVANGHLAPQMEGLRSSAGYKQRNQLFLNDGAGKFTDCVSCFDSGAAIAHSSRGCAHGDLDGDGDPDVVVNNIDDEPTILENRSRGSWLEARLRGTRSNRTAIGARVFVTAGGRRQERQIQSGMSWASQCELAARFGLGQAERVEELRVEWPSGLTESFPPPKLAPPRTRVLLVEGRGQPSNGG